MARRGELPRWRALVRWYASIPVFVQFDVPTLPEPAEYVQSDHAVWWFTNQRSQWTVIEDCWSVDEVDPAWWSIEASVRSLLTHFDSVHLVSSDLDWTTDGFCIRVQGLAPSVYEQRESYQLQLKNGPLKWVSNEATTLDAVHYAWLYSKEDIPIYWAQKQIWKGFWKAATQRTLVFAPPQHEGYIARLKTFESNSVTGRSWRLFSKSDRTTPELSTCMLQQTSHPQIAVTIEVRFDGLSTAELRVLNLILGTGVRSRLSQRVREEEGLVYSIGSTFTGTAIQVEYTVSPINVLDSIHAVSSVLHQLSLEGVSQREWQTARSTFLLRQYEILEDPASMIRMFGRFTYSQGWSKYIDQTIQVFNEASLVEQSIRPSIARYWLTGDLNPETVLQTSTRLGVCEALEEHMLLRP